jgi:alkyl hydroperoxide reductase subunit F
MEGSITPYNCIVVGAGPAGITASIYLARKNLDILVISQDIGGQAFLSSCIENYLGYKLITGPELVTKFKNHMKSFKIDLAQEKVLKIKRFDELFLIETDKRRYLANTVIVASGKTPFPLNVPGEKKLMGRGVTYCAILDAPAAIEIHGQNILG